MEVTDGYVTSANDDYTVEQKLFTYSEEEREENSLNKLNADLILKPEFLTVDYAMLHSGFSMLETALYGFIKFFLTNNERFYCTNEQLAEMLCASENTISNAISKLKAEWLIDLTLKIKAGGWKVRFIRLTKSVSPTPKICASDTQNLWGIYNKLIENKKRNIKEKKKNTSTASNTIPTVDELVTAYRETPELVRKIKDEDAVRMFAEYKQSTKKTAYKTVGWFIQKLISYIPVISHWEIRYDVGERLKYAVNESRDNWRIKLVRNDEMEQWFQTVKKFNSLTKKQDV